MIITRNMSEDQYRENEQKYVDELEQERWQQEMNEQQMREEMEKMFDLNGDPINDFLGNPW